MKLYNLTYQDKYYSSGIEPKSLPEDNFCYVDVEYKDGNIRSVQGTYVKDEVRKESVLSDLNVEIYIEKLKEFLKRDDLDKDKIHLNFVENVENEDERILKIFLILISSYLIYFNFLEFPYTVSLSLLSNEKFKYFTSFSPTSKLEVSFIDQVSLLHRYFSDIFSDGRDEQDFVHQIRQYKRRILSDVEKRLSPLQDLKTEVEELRNLKNEVEELRNLKNKLFAIFKNDL